MQRRASELSCWPPRLWRLNPWAVCCSRPPQDCVRCKGLLARDCGGGGGGPAGRVPANAHAFSTNSAFECRTRLPLPMSMQHLDMLPHTHSSAVAAMCSHGACNHALRLLPPPLPKSAAAVSVLSLHSPWLPCSLPRPCASLWWLRPPRPGPQRPWSPARAPRQAHCAHVAGSRVARRSRGAIDRVSPSPAAAARCGDSCGRPPSPGGEPKHDQ